MCNFCILSYALSVGNKINNVTVSFDLVVHYPIKSATQEAVFHCEDKHTANEMYWGPKIRYF